MVYKLRDTFQEDGYYVTQNYNNNPAYYKQFNLLGHEGVDFSHTDKIKKVRSPLGGTCFVGTDKNYGSFVVIEDYRQQCAAYLCHMQNVKVTNGQEIKAGDEVGEMDDTGNANGEHVHLNFLILNNGSNKYHKKEFNWGYLDPQYPRDTGKIVKYSGVEDYKIEWYTGSQNEPAKPDPAPEPAVDAPSNKELSQQIEELKNIVQVLSEDREIIVDTKSKVASLESKFDDLSKKLDTHMKDLKADVQEVPQKVEQSVQDTVETVTDAVNKKDNVILVLNKQNVLETLIKIWRSLWQPKNLT